MELGAAATATPQGTSYTEDTAARYALCHGRPARVDINQVDRIEALVNDRPATPFQCHEEECAIAHSCVRLANAPRKRYELRYDSNLGRNGTTDVVGREQRAMVRSCGQGCVCAVSCFKVCNIPGMYLVVPLVIAQRY